MLNNSNFQMYNPYSNPYNPYNPVSVTGNNSPYQSQRQEVTKVNGREGANAYPLSPNSSTLLLDINQPIVYLKQSDGAGYCTINAYTISPVKEECVNNITDTNDLEKRIKRLEDMLINEPDTTTSRKSKQSEYTKSDKSN